MTETIEQDVVAPQETSTASLPADDWEKTTQKFIDEFDRSIAQPETEQPATNGQDPLDALLAELTTPSPDQQKIAELEGQLSSAQGQLSSAQSAEFLRQEREAATKWAAELQDVCSRSNPNIESDFVIREIKVLSADNPGMLEAAWQYRNLSDADLATAKRDFAAAERLYAQAVAAPDTDPRKKEALRFLEQRGAQLQAMLSARSVIRSAHNQIRKRAESVKAPYDPDVSATREEIAHLMKEGGSGRGVPPEPPVQLGGMSDAEYRAYLKTLGIAGF